MRCSLLSHRSPCGKLNGRLIGLSASLLLPPHPQSSQLVVVFKHNIHPILKQCNPGVHGVCSNRWKTMSLCSARALCHNTRQLWADGKTANNTALWFANRFITSEMESYFPYSLIFFQFIPQWSEPCFRGPIFKDRKGSYLIRSNFPSFHSAYKGITRCVSGRELSVEKGKFISKGGKVEQESFWLQA